MNRTATIITVAAATALVASAGIAAVAVIHSATSAPQNETLSVVASAGTGSAVALPDPNTGSLPAVTLDASAAQLPSADQALASQPVAQQAAKANSAAVKPRVQSSATPMSEQARSLTSDQAISVIKANVDGAISNVSVRQTTHGGYDAWAVTFSKADGSVLTGYVYLYDQDGTVFDWKVVRDPNPVVVTVPASTTAVAPPRGDDRHESDHRDGSGDRSSNDQGTTTHGSEHDDD